MTITREHAQSIADLLERALEMAPTVIDALSKVLPDIGSDRAIPLALMIVARMDTDVVMPSPEAFADIARVVAGYLQLREDIAKKAREAHP